MIFKTSRIISASILLLVALLSTGCNSPVSPDEPPVTAEDEAPDFSNHNVDSVQNGGTSPGFTIQEEDVRITSIQTYHWNEGAGTGETGTISLQGDDGTVYGPFETTGSEGQGGVPNAYWNAEIDIELPPGSYTVLDSDPGTWAQNAGSGGKGMVNIDFKGGTWQGGR